LSKIISIGTAVPPFKHEQRDILGFMEKVYALNEIDKRKIKFLYQHSGIETRYSVIPDYSRNISDWKFYPQTENLEPFPSLELRMKWFSKSAAPLSVHAIIKCIDGILHPGEISHLITVSCTGMTAPGLDLQIMELMQLPTTICRTSINFMGCYAAIHALKMANAVCLADPSAKVLVVCTELCTLHFQHEPSMDNISSSLLFADGSAAALVTGDNHKNKGIRLKHFYSEVLAKGKKDMAWEISSTGFLMTLSNYIPDLLEENFEKLTSNALMKSGLTLAAISQWCIHPGGKKILESVAKSLKLEKNQLQPSYEILQKFGNMSSPTILFVLERIMADLVHLEPGNIFGAAFGPGLTIETFIGSA
jgi:predicted naringenin-chalcone synthase